MAEKLQAGQKTITERASEVEPVFYERLSFLMEVNNLDCDDVVKGLKALYSDCRLSGNGVNRWCSKYSEYHIPNFRYLIGLCKILKCSGSYLLGVDNVYHPTVKVRKISKQA